MHVMNPIARCVKALALADSGLPNLSEMVTNRVAGGYDANGFLLAREDVDTAEHGVTLAPVPMFVCTIPNEDVRKLRLEGL